MHYIIDPNANASACCLVNCRRQLGTKTWHFHQGGPRPTLVDEKFKKCPDPSAPYTLAFYKDKIVCDQCWHNSALGEEVSAWLQVTFMESYDILTNVGWQANVDVSKPLTPQFKAEVIKRMRGKTEKPEALKYAEADAKILEKVKADALKYSTAPPWLNKVDPTKPLTLQVKAFNKRQAAEQRAHRLQQEQDGIKDEWADSN